MLSERETVVELPWLRTVARASAKLRTVRVTSDGIRDGVVQLVCIFGGAVSSARAWARPHHCVGTACVHTCARTCRGLLLCPRKCTSAGTARAPASRASGPSAAPYRITATCVMGARLATIRPTCGGNTWIKRIATFGPNHQPRSPNVILIGWQSVRQWSSFLGLRADVRA
jgi:hypothetical protein